MIIALLLIIPLLASLILFSGKLGAQSKNFAFATSWLVFGISLIGGFYLAFTNENILLFNRHFITFFDVDLLLKIDTVSIILVVLTTLLTPIIIASTEKKDNRNHSFYALIMLMEMALIGVFTASEMILFYIFWELALIPIFFITAFWGGENSRKITFKFFIYTIVGSLFMLVGILYVYTRTALPHSFSYDAFYQVGLTYNEQVWVFLAFFAAFAIKIPLFPFHSWQAETYNTSPVQGTMLMAGIMLKMGLYGIFRFLLPLCPDVVANGSLIFLPLILFGVIYGAIIAINQPNLKKLIAFASLSHVGIIALGLLSGNKHGIDGAILQMFSHGVNVVGFFLCYQMIVSRTGTDKISDLGGIAMQAPRFAVVFMIVVLANVALPLTNSFVGEFLILLGLFTFSPWLAVLVGLTIIFGAVYMLKMFQKVMLGKPTKTTLGFQDLTTAEMLLFVPIVICIFLVGIYPSFVLHMLETVGR